MSSRNGSSSHSRDSTSRSTNEAGSHTSTMSSQSSSSSNPIPIPSSGGRMVYTPSPPSDPTAPQQMYGTSVPSGGVFFMDRESPSPIPGHYVSARTHNASTAAPQSTSNHFMYSYAPATALQTQNAQRNNWAQPVYSHGHGSSNAYPGSSSRDATMPPYSTFPSTPMTSPPSYHTPTAHLANPIAPPPYSQGPPSSQFPASPVSSYYGGVQGSSRPPPYQPWPQGQRPSRSGGSSTMGGQGDSSGQQPHDASRREHMRRPHDDRR